MASSKKLIQNPWQRQILKDPWKWRVLKLRTPENCNKGKLTSLHFSKIARPTMVKWYKKKKRKKAKAKATKHFRKMQKGYEASVLKSISSKVFLPRLAFCCRSPIKFWSTDHHDYRLAARGICSELTPAVLLHNTFSRRFLEANQATFTVKWCSSAKLL